MAERNKKSHQQWDGDFQLDTVHKNTKLAQLHEVNTTFNV